LKVLVSTLLALALTSSVRALEIFELLGVDTDPVLKHRQLYGCARAFSAEVYVTIGCSTNCPSRTSVIRCARSVQGWFRNEVDLTKTTFPGRRNAAEVWGRERNVIIWRLDRNMEYFIVPDRKGYFEQPGTIKPGEKYEPPRPEPVVRKQQQGTETIDGHPCLKILRAIIPYEGAKPRDVTAWEATDLDGFCIQLQYNDAPIYCENTPCVITILFKKISFKPEPALFEIPKDYRKYEDPLELEELGTTGAAK
jgi:hypothetical protein